MNPVLLFAWSAQLATSWGYCYDYDPESDPDIKSTQWVELGERAGKTGLRSVSFKALGGVLRASTLVSAVVIISEA